MSAIPNSVSQMLQKFSKSNPPHSRKRIEVACVIHATDIEKAARELEELAITLREQGTGFVGHGSGYYMSITYAAISN